MPRHAAASPDDIEMSSIFGALKAALPRLLMWSALLGALAFAVLSMMAPKFQSQADMSIVARASPGMFSDPKNQGGNPESITIKMDKEAINTHVRALQAPDLVARIAEEMKLAEKPEFNAELGPVDLLDRVMRLIGIGGPRAGESERDRVMAAVYKQLEVYAAKETRFIGVRMTSTDPQLAADIANRIADTYRNSLATQGVSEIGEQQKVLVAKIAKLKPEVADAEKDVERYRGEIDVFRGGAQNTGLNEQQLSELTGELTKAKAARSEAEARAKSAREMMKIGSADALPDVQKSPLIQNLVQQRVRIERQISELSASLLPGHPRMRQMNADLAGLKKQLTSEIAKLVDSLDKEAKVMQGREESIKKSVDEIKARVVSNAPEEAKLRQLEANAKAKRTELENIQAQIESNRKREDTRSQPVEAQITSKAQAASVPVFPKKLPNAALVSFATLLLGTFWTITRALFAGARSGGGGYQPDMPRVSAKPASGARAEPSLAAAPSAPSPKAAAPAAAAAHEMLAPKTIGAIAIRLRAAASAQGGHRTLIAGETIGIDGTAEAADVCKALATEGAQVILVDWSPSGRGMSGAIGLSAGKGLTELILGDVGFEDVVQRLPGSQVHFISCGAPLDENAGDVDPDQLNLVLDALDEAYDHIVVTGQHDDARHLFEAIQGRFDAGILVLDPKKRASVLQDPVGTFLGFEVADIDVIRFERTAPATPPVNQRIVRATQRPSSEAVPN